MWESAVRGADPHLMLGDGNQARSTAAAVASVAADEAVDDAAGVAGVVGVKVVLLKAGGAGQIHICHSRGRWQQQNGRTVETASRTPRVRS